MSKDPGPEDPALVIFGGDLVYCNLNGARSELNPPLKILVSVFCSGEKHLRCLVNMKVRLSAIPIEKRVS